MRLYTILLAALTVAACGDPDIFARVAAPESEDVAAASWPRLADIPPTPPQGVYTAAAPDPATGEAVVIETQAAAASQESRREKVMGPVE